jgi:hypothetical protein
LCEKFQEKESRRFQLAPRNISHAMSYHKLRSKKCSFGAASNSFRLRKIPGKSFCLTVDDIPEALKGSNPNFDELLTSVNEASSHSMMKSIKM